MPVIIAPKRAGSRTPNSPSRQTNAQHPSPPKVLRVDDHHGTETPSSVRKIYSFDNLGLALSHYFSPKKKSPNPKFCSKSLTASPSRGPRRRLDFVNSCKTNFQEKDDQSSENESMEDQPFNDGGLFFTPSLAYNCDMNALIEYFEKADDYLPDQIKNKMEMLEEKHFDQWIYWLRSGNFNILLHGLGSKRNLLENFFQHIKSGQETKAILVSGYSPNASMQKIVDTINREFELDVPRGRQPFKEYVENVRSAIDREQTRLFLVIKSLDGQNLCSNLQQEALAALAASKYVHLIASVDHVNASLMWSKNTCEQFSWLYVPVSTWHCYGNEVLSTGNSKILRLDNKSQGRKHSPETLEMFWQATTENMHKILEQLAIHCPSIGGNYKNYPSLSIPRFCAILKEKFATTSETTLCQQLTEFVDHKLIKMDKENNNIQLVVDRKILTEFLETKLSSF